MDHSDETATPFILVVEDEALVAMEMEAYVRAFGYFVLGPASSVEAAGGILDRNKPDAALLDVNLRGHTVAPIAHRLRQSKVPYALVTGYGPLDLDDPALADAPRLSKPVREADVERVLSRLLQQI